MAEDQSIEIQTNLSCGQGARPAFIRDSTILGKYGNYRPYLLVKRGSTFGKKVLQYEETGLKVSVSMYGVHALPYST
jgi:hypothetical protein